YHWIPNSWAIFQAVFSLGCIVTSQLLLSVFREWIGCDLLAEFFSWIRDLIERSPILLRVDEKLATKYNTEERVEIGIFVSRLNSIRSAVYIFSSREGDAEVIRVDP